MTTPQKSCNNGPSRPLQGQHRPHVLAQLLQISAVLLNVAFLISASPVAGARPWSIVVPSLEYYVQVGLGAADLGVLIPAIDSNNTHNFGQTQLFAFNVTRDADASSTLLGYIRGYTIQASYTSDEHGVEVEVLSYDDGTRNGTISLQGLINSSTNEIALVGGTGDFRGVRGYGIITPLNSTATLALYHHELFFL